MCGCCYSLLSDTSPAAGGGEAVDDGEPGRDGTPSPLSPAAGGGGEAVDNGEPGRDDTSSPLSLLGSVLC